MHVAAIYNLPAAKNELANALAGLGVTLYEARSRLRAAGKGPFVVSVNAKHNVVENIVKKLHSGGLDAIALYQDEIGTVPNHFTVRKFILDKEGIKRELVLNPGTVAVWPWTMAVLTSYCAVHV